VGKGGGKNNEKKRMVGGRRKKKRGWGSKRLTLTVLKKKGGGCLVFLFFWFVLVGGGGGGFYPAELSGRSKNPGSPGDTNKTPVDSRGFIFFPGTAKAQKNKKKKPHLRGGLGRGAQTPGELGFVNGGPPTRGDAPAFLFKNPPPPPDGEQFVFGFDWGDWLVDSKHFRLGVEDFIN